MQRSPVFFASKKYIFKNAKKTFRFWRFKLFIICKSFKGRLLTWELGEQRVVWEDTSGLIGTPGGGTVGDVSYIYYPASLSNLEAHDLLSALANHVNNE